MYDVLKALHIVFLVSWFAGLFYIVRLFIYHVEAERKQDPEKEILQNQFKIMENRLWYIITWPAMIGTVVCGVWMLVLLPPLLSQVWMLVKLCFVVVLLMYHLASHVIFLQLKRNEIKYSSLQLRIWNEVATLLLVAIVFLVVLRNGLHAGYGTLAFFGVAILLMLGIKLYKKTRK